MRGTIERIAVFFFLAACLLGPFPSFAQKSGVLSKSTEAEPPAFGPANSNTASLTAARKPTENWIPEDMDRFTATEVLVHQEVDHSGRLGRAVTVKFEYLVSISEERDGWLGVDELRNRSHTLDSFPSHLATTGTPSLVLIFHPRYTSDFRTRCEGLGEWHGQPAWQVRFEQRADRPNHICSFIVNGAMYRVNLRGRAWILADSFQVARLETDIEESVPKIRLRLNHESIEYRPVSSPTRNLQLWLPSSTELYLDFRGHRFYRKHSFTDFKIFSVDMQYQMSGPK